jgi:hypothetical protein
MENFHEEGKTWAQVYGKSSKRALERWARCLGDKNERPEENSDSHGTRSVVLGEVSRHAIPPNGGLSPNTNKKPHRVVRSVPLGRRRVFEDYE